MSGSRMWIPRPTGWGFRPLVDVTEVIAMRVLTCPLNPLRRSKTDVKIRPLLAYIAMQEPQFRHP
jgi:hypothetical protein